jgi:hypothetical protein
MRSVIALGLVAAAGVNAQSSPVTRVVELIKGLKSEIEKDGAAEQKTYDKFACWCEETSERKATAISEARDSIDRLSKLIVELKGQIGTLKVDVSQLKKDIEANIKSQQDATALRQKEHDGYAAMRMETEQATAALKKAVDVLAGAGTGRKSGSALQEAETLSVVAGVRNALKMLPSADALDSEDMEMVKAFVGNPLGKKAAFLQAKLNNNPFGDYAPASTKIQGILKNMYDTFLANMQTANEDEGTKQKSFEELIATKQEELAALKATLANKQQTLGEKTKELADSKQQRQETEEQLAADEKFFADTKAACAAKADEWAERTRLRTEELAGIANALKTLDSPEARATFESSATTFLQFNTRSVKLTQTVNKLKAMATKSHSLRLASLAVTVQQTAGSKMGRDAFAEIMGEIEKMISNLRREEQDDLDHRDFCEQSQNALGGENDSLNHTKENAEAKKERMKAKSEALAGEIKMNEEAKDAQEKELEDALNTRNEEHEEYIQALKDDKAAIALLAKAIEQMSAFYSNNGIAFVQQPEYSTDADKAPETFGDKPYGGRKSESTGVFAILEMIKEDIEKEVGEAKKSEGEATKAYEGMRAAGRETVETLTNLINSLSKEKAAVDTKTANLEGDIADLDGQIGGNEGEAAAMKENCEWILTSFESRKTKRINEINGLQTAKSFLLGTDNAAQDDSAKYGNGMGF